MSLANYFTFMRIIISPIFLLVYVKAEALGISMTTLPYVLLSLFVVSEISDFFDGYLARKFNQVTDLGKILDPMADSIARISMFLTFTTGPVQLSLLWVFIIFYRDAVVSTLRTICALRGFALAARASGKAKAVIQALAAFIILLCMIPYSLGQLELETLQSVAATAVGTAAIYTLFSGADYIYANWEHIRRMLIVSRGQNNVGQAKT